MSHPRPRPRRLGVPARRARTARPVVPSRALLVACGGGSDDSPPAPGAAGDTVALTISGKLISFHRAAPSPRCVA